VNIAYLCADFGVPIFGYKGASIHVREMVTAFCKAGHKVSIISPAIEKAEVEPALPKTLGGPEKEERKGEVRKNVSLLHVLPAERHLQHIKDLEDLDKFLGRKTRLAGAAQFVLQFDSV
jgi:hypothetical protein